MRKQVDGGEGRTAKAGPKNKSVNGRNTVLVRMNDLERMCSADPTDSDADGAGGIQFDLDPQEAIPNDHAPIPTP